MLGGPRQYTLDELAAHTGLTKQFITDYWLWLGLPVQLHEERWFTDSDLVALREIAHLAEAERLDEGALRSLVRSLGHTTERLAFWQFETFVENASRAHDTEDIDSRLLVLRRLPHLVGVLGHQLEHAWRRQLLAVTERYAAEFSGATSAGPNQLPLRRAVGFADVVSFTKRTALLGPSELADFLQTFESRARDVVAAAGGRVVKTVGDAVLFIADSPQIGAEVALGLSAPNAHKPEIPVRIGLVWGRVLSRFGDVFGPSVNLASRLTEVCNPGEVFVDAATAEVLRSHHEYALLERSSQHLEGVGEVITYRLERAQFGIA